MPTIEDALLALLARAEAEGKPTLAGALADAIEAATEAEEIA
jgi:hypothetical protein